MIRRDRLTLGTWLRCKRKRSKALRANSRQRTEHSKKWLNVSSSRQSSTTSWCRNKIRPWFLQVEMGRIQSLDNRNLASAHFRWIGRDSHNNSLIFLVSKWGIQILEMTMFHRVVVLEVLRWVELIILHKVVVLEVLRWELLLKQRAYLHQVWTIKVQIKARPLAKVPLSVNLNLVINLKLRT